MASTSKNISQSNAHEATGLMLVMVVGTATGNN